MLEEGLDDDDDRLSSFLPSSAGENEDDVEFNRKAATNRASKECAGGPGWLQPSVQGQCSLNGQSKCSHMASF